MLERHSLQGVLISMRDLVSTLCMGLWADQSQLVQDLKTLFSIYLLSP